MSDNYQRYTFKTYKNHVLSLFSNWKVELRNVPNKPHLVSFRVIDVISEFGDEQKINNLLEFNKIPKARFLREL